MKNLLKIFDTLGIDKSNGLFITDENLWQEQCQFSSRVKRLIQYRLKPDAFFIFDHKPLILFYDTPKEEDNIQKALWNFNESPIIIFAYDNDIKILNGYNYLKEKKSLEEIAKKENINDFDYFEVVSGNTWEKYQSQLRHEDRVDFNLLKNIKTAREILISEDNLNPNIANALIGKVIFVRYLIDRKVKIGFDEEKHWTNADLCSLLSNYQNAIRFFKHLENKFNGDMFSLNDIEYQCIQQNSLNTIINLLNEEDLGNGQKSLFKLYDFSIIPIEFISNVYESFIGEQNQADEGAYYTPLFLVDYILNETVEKHLLNNPEEYNCKVLDPACGSGIFLVETLRKIIERYIDLHPEIKEDSEEFKDIIRQLAIDNIFGIDKNLSAIQVAIFSIQLTLLDYQNPSSVETFRFPKLLHTNFFEADFFDTQHKYNDLLQKQDLCFIIGNPPWKGNGIGSLGKQYLKDRKKREKDKKHSIAINNGEIAEGFVLRVSDFANPNTQIALLVRSSILYNLGYKKNRSGFRDYWTEEFFINRVFELAPVRKEVFDKSNDPSIAPTAILFYKYANGENTNNNLIEHITLKPSRFFSLFKIFTINKSDIKNVEQKRLKDYDWLWKVLVYGSYLDFIFIKGLKEKYPTINEIISDKTKFVKGTGIHMKGSNFDGSKIPSTMNSKTLLRPNAVDILYINYSSTEPFDEKRVDRIRNSNLFKAPMLLVKKGVDTNTIKTKSAIADKDIMFKDGLTSVKDIRGDKKILQRISALLFSEFYSYFAINTFVSIGIEREQAQNYNKFSLPYIECKIEPFVSKIERLNKKIAEESNKFPINEVTIEKLNDDIISNFAIIDKKIFDVLDLDERECSLIDFALNINRPLITKNQKKIAELFKPFDFEDGTFENYISVFANRFSKSLNTSTHDFVTEIWYSKQLIGVFFRVEPKRDNLKPVVWIDKSKDDILIKIIKLSSQKITDKLFVQKDIRGFEKDFFYIFKPNEKKLWHKAVGYQDVDEFTDAILKAGGRNSN
jgi:hypothetical protein